jgi:hypothetical protein
VCVVHERREESRLFTKYLQKSIVHYFRKYETIPEFIDLHLVLSLDAYISKQRIEKNKTTQWQELLHTFQYEYGI